MKSKKRVRYIMDPLKSFGVREFSSRVHFRLRCADPEGARDQATLPGDGSDELLKGVDATRGSNAQHADRLAVERRGSNEPIKAVLDRTCESAGVLGGCDEHGVYFVELRPKTDHGVGRIVGQLRNERRNGADPNDFDRRHLALHEPIASGPQRSRVGRSLAEASRQHPDTHEPILRS